MLFSRKPLNLRMDIHVQNILEKCTIGLLECLDQCPIWGGWEGGNTFE